MRGVYQGLGNFAVQTRQAHLKASLEAETVVSGEQVHFGINGRLWWHRDLPLAPAVLIFVRKQDDQPAANSCSGLVPLPGLPGNVSLMSRRPSGLREAPPSRPPMV
jgi:hypothetical protein